MGSRTTVRVLSAKWTRHYARSDVLLSPEGTLELRSLHSLKGEPPDKVAAAELSWMNTRRPPDKPERTKVCFLRVCVFFLFFVIFSACFGDFHTVLFCVFFGSSVFFFVITQLVRN